mgnify:CR=1 FL=1
MVRMGALRALGVGASPRPNREDASLACLHEQCLPACWRALEGPRKLLAPVRPQQHAHLFSPAAPLCRHHIAVVWTAANNGYTRVGGWVGGWAGGCVGGWWKEERLGRERSRGHNKPGLAWGRVCSRPPAPTCRPLLHVCGACCMFTVQIYWDGLLMASAITGKTKPLQQGGALMLGAEQDCYGGCTDRHAWGRPAGRVSTHLLRHNLGCPCAWRHAGPATHRHSRLHIVANTCLPAANTCMPQGPGLLRFDGRSAAVAHRSLAV